MQNDMLANTDRVLRALSDIARRMDARRLRVFVTELFTWNPSLRLISKRDPARTAARLIRLSVNLWDFLEKEISPSQLPSPVRVVDIGSGAGFPGLIWKLLDDGISIDLVERSEKKSAFLERMLKLLSLDHARAVFADAQDMAVQPSYQECYRIVTMLAVSSPVQMSSTVESLLMCPGYFVTLRGTNERIIKDTLGERLRIRNAVSSDDGIHVIYEKTP